ncbi:MAG: molybdopterin molybdotransferase MoeA [Gemmatimonadetes bacterium]|nr:molybdopterin molybdotransferase MoeA [Gemmatimonadota bacterium]
MADESLKVSLEVADAVARVVAAISCLSVERVPLSSARGRVLASPVVSRVSLPPWDNSAMDGYAVRAEDIAAIPTTLRVLETVAAGQFPTQPVAKGTAIRIMTGAPTPAGADTVVRVDDTDGGRERVVVRLNRDARKNVRPRGEDIIAGREALAAGTTLGPAQRGGLAAVGTIDVDVYRVPRVAILTSGDELVTTDRFDEVLAGKKIVSSNSVTLHELVRDAGAEPVDLGIAADTPASLREHLARAVAPPGADLIITSGGISVGEFDFMRPVLAELGASLDFWRVRMRPGAPIGFGMLGTTPWLGLPGNPVSTMVTFELFARPAIRKMRGHAALFRSPIPVTVEEPISVSVELTHFLRAVVTRHDDGHRTARLTGSQSSGILSSMALANALVIVPRGTLQVAAGATLMAIPLGVEGAFDERFSA